MKIKPWIIYEDKNIIVFNKPRGILVQQDGLDCASLDILVNDYLGNKNNGPAHRLDRDTSGIVVFGKNQDALAELNKLFQNRDSINKHYLTLVSGVTDDEGEITAPLRKNFQLKKMVVAPLKSGAKEAITRYKTVKKFESYSLLDVELVTGRTHQIRAHMSYIRHHVVGDSKYGDFKVNNYFEKEYELKGQFLHSSSIKFSNIKGKLSYLSGQEFQACMPEEFEKILNNLK